MNYGIVIGLSIVAPFLVILGRSALGITPSEYQLLGWLGVMVFTQFHAFVSLPSPMTTILISIGLGMIVLFVYDLVFLLNSGNGG